MEVKDIIIANAARPKANKLYEVLVYYAEFTGRT
jgi:hypothetical protein